jgi:hypothetical protein
MEVDGPSGGYQAAGCARPSSFFINCGDQLEPLPTSNNVTMVAINDNTKEEGGDGSIQLCPADTGVLLVFDSIKSANGTPLDSNHKVNRGLW